ncbi:MAG TPA: IS110 family transposase [Burkholderiales bacterium]|nr:IS110 family transposase [Burkholderiales bacterium]
MAMTRQALEVNDTDAAVRLYMALELSDGKWKVVVGDNSRAPSQHSVGAGEALALLALIEKAKKRCGLDGATPVVSCYEAGRDGFWLHRWLVEHGVANVVVDSSSIEVNRRQRRAKSDRLDALKLYEMLVRYFGGERRVWQVVRVPTVQEEDARRPHRERERLQRERNAHLNRICSLALLHNVRLQRQRGMQVQVAALEGRVPTALLNELRRECERLQLIERQMRELAAAIDAQAESLLEQQGPLAALMKVRSIGIKSAWILVNELFGWRRFNNRREVAGCVGLTPTPYDSGGSTREQGISKAGNRRLRALLVELAWLWLRHQPQSALSLWFGERFAGGGKRMRRIGIVAMARRLLVALWRYVQHGVIPAGAQLKAA